MYLIYNILIYLAGFILRALAFFDPKIKLFVSGRSESFARIKAKINPDDNVIWFHCASLGEFEQGRPLIEAIKKEMPDKKLVLTFFSPSGYEVRKKYELADVVCYLPMDTNSNMRKFLSLVHPEVVVFVKYEFWPNILKHLKAQEIRTILVSGIFRKDQAFFRWYGGWMRKSLRSFTHFFVQDKNSIELLNNIGIANVTCSGDTRFDRVFDITQQENNLDFMDAFANSGYTVVAGSTWKEDEELLVNYINSSAAVDEKFVLAPHNIDKEAIKKLRLAIKKPSALYSDRNETELSEKSVLILDTIGLLTKVYSYADLAYVGGGFTKTGVHNLLEPATFGIPIVIGPQYDKFNEAIDLVRIKACYSIENSQKLSVILSTLYENEIKRKETGARALNYVEERRGATQKILKYLY